VTRPDSFYKASRALLERTDLTPAEKLVRIVQADWRAFRGGEPTALQLAEATGLGERTVRRFLAAKLAGSEAAKMPANLAGEAANLAALHSSSDIQTKERDTDALSLSATRGEEKTDGPAVAKAMAGLPAVGVLALLHLKAVEGGGKWALAKWVGHVEEDEAAGRYARAELAAFVAGRTAVTESPWRLAESVRRHADAARAAAFRERLRRIQADGLTDARREGDKRRWRVRYPDAGEGLLVLESVVDLPRPPRVAELERALASARRLSLGRRSVDETMLEGRIAALRAGRPDPCPPSVPAPEKIEIRRPEDLKGWTFRPDQPVLAFAAGPEPVEGRGRERSE